MKLWTLILCVIPSITSITISSNGNSPETKIVSHVELETLNDFKMMTDRSDNSATNRYKATRDLKINSTKIGINERYRRLIPYMTFYYANDIATPPTLTRQEEAKSVEVEKAHIIETGNIAPNQRDERVIHTFGRHKNIPRYQGNRLTQHNIASANPTKLYLKEMIPVFYQPTENTNPNFNPVPIGFSVQGERNYDRYIVKPNKPSIRVPFAQPTRKPYLNVHQNEDANIQYYLSEKEEATKYKLVPYEQTPPIKFHDQTDEIEVNRQQYHPVVIPKESVYIKPKPTQSQHTYQNYDQQYKTRRPPTTISEMYYEKQTPVVTLAEPVIEGGFRPIIPSQVHATESPHIKPQSYHERVPEFDQIPEEIPNRQPNYQYVLEEPSYISKPTHNEKTKTVSLADLLNSLQINKSIPKPITKDNVSASIATLLQVLNTLKAQQNEVEAPVLSTPKAFEAPEVIIKTTPAPPTPSTLDSPQHSVEFNEEHYLAPVNTPSQHLDDFPTGGSSQQFPLQIHSDDEGGTPGRPGVDYPILTVIPPTKFDCKTQRYKGFFADPETRCQVWHYCDLNGGQASFLCPNGTIFSQAALTCDWWFNVRCASTAQLYVLNESLYKFILPHSPKFPEDYSGPLVDKYLTLKFKEMEEQFKKNKNKSKTASEKVDDEGTNEKIPEATSREDKGSDDGGTSISNAGVIVESAGASGNVERLQE
ncbi:uncharacterized protein LOC119839487 [Zerene cesonia]|uniref:uncharacterized protein LOC119839487 n=1 Tax=Zerene cesonia TaxID=33412 RepID=UPI0018E55B6E|nr:uncharacterized protein LOC119839487 [Zerene cesonia]